VADDTQTDEARKSRRSPRLIARWLLRFLVRSIAVAGITLLITATVAAVVYANRVRIVNQTLDILAEPYDISLGKIELHRLGQVRIADLRLAPKNASTDHPVAVISEVEITYSFKVLRSTRKLKTLKLKSVKVELDDDTLASLSASKVDSPDGAPGFDLSVLAYYTDSFSITDAHLIFDKTGAPRIEADWQFSSGPLEFDNDGLIRAPLVVEFSNVVVGDKGKESRIARLSVDAKVNRNFSHIEIDSVAVEKPDLTITPALFAGGKQGLADDPTGLSAPPPPVDSNPDERSPLDLAIASFSVTDASISVIEFPNVPGIFFDTNLAIDDIAFKDGLWSSNDPVDLRLINFAIGESGAQLASAGYVDLSIASLAELVERQTISEIKIAKLDAVVSDKTLGFLTGETSESSASGDPWVIERATIEDGRFLLRDATFGDSPSPRIATSVEATLEDLHFGPTGFSSGGEQLIQLTQTNVWAPGVEGGDHALLNLKSAELTIAWPDFDKNFTIERIKVNSPVIDFTDNTLGDWLSGVASESAPRPRNRPVYKVADLSVTDGKILADSSFAEEKVPKITADFSLSTLKDAEDPYSYSLNFSDLEIRNHARAAVPAKPPEDPTLFPEGTMLEAIAPLLEAEVISVEDIDLVFTATELQRTRRIEKVRVSGATLKVGEGLKSLVGTETPKEEATPKPETPSDMPTWTIGEIELSQSRVEFEALIPQVEGLNFTIKTTLSDVPLSLKGLLAQDELQKIEIAGIEINDPYDSFITVAELPSIFVQFSLAGLARQEIEKIDLLSPTLYVGQGLFWWIEYQRKFREQNEGASIGIDGQGQLEEGPDWTIKTLNAEAGKIVISPTGVPIGVVPFPFNATTTMSEGNIELKLNIPSEDFVYRFPVYKVDLYGLTGDIQFNVPVEEVDNNLVQTFALKKAVWKDFEAKDLFISVTFDSKGIYGLFGGAAYEGYARGGFNFYLDDDGKWDAWVSGTDFESGPLTEAIAPETFLMDGLVSLEVVSEGRNKSLGETTGDFTTTGPGWFDITKLNEIFENLPEEWNSLQRSLTELSLIALKRFDYDTGVGTLYLLGQEGELDLKFAGPYGTRDITVHAHDERNKSAPIESTPEIVPQAAARPVQ